jgi:hypothetical protein
MGGPWPGPDPHKMLGLKQLGAEKIMGRKECTHSGEQEAHLGAPENLVTPCRL